MLTQLMLYVCQLVNSSHARRTAVQDYFLPWCSSTEAEKREGWPRGCEQRYQSLCFFFTEQVRARNLAISLSAQVVCGALCTQTRDVVLGRANREVSCESYPCPFLSWLFVVQSWTCPVSCCSSFLALCFPLQFPSPGVVGEYSSDGIHDVNVLSSSIFLHVSTSTGVFRSYVGYRGSLL